MLKIRRERRRWQRRSKGGGRDGESSGSTDMGVGQGNLLALPRTSPGQHHYRARQIRSDGLPRNRPPVRTTWEIDRMPGLPPGLRGYRDARRMASRDGAWPLPESASREETRRMASLPPGL